MIRQIVTLFSDITTIKQAEEALAASEEQRRLFIEYAPAGLAMFDRDMRYLYTRATAGLPTTVSAKRDLHGLSHYDVFPEIPGGMEESASPRTGGRGPALGRRPLRKVRTVR
jgi:PAS domain-containing protein